MILNKEKGAIIMKKEGICPNCNNVIIVDDQNQANICPICNQPYVSQVAINSYYNQGNAQNGNISLLDSYTTKVKRLLSVNMWSEAQEVAKEAIKLYPDKYQSRVLKVIIETNDYKRTNFEDINIFAKDLSEIDKFRQLDGIHDSEFQQLYNKFKERLKLYETLCQLCNRLPPLKVFEILQVYEMRIGTKYLLNTDFFVFKNYLYPHIHLADIFYDVNRHCCKGLMITYTFKGWHDKYYDQEISYLLKMRGSIEEKISILEREAQQTYNTSSCCPFCGDPIGLFRNCRCQNSKSKSKHQFYWMRNR